MEAISRSQVAEITSLWQQGSLTAPNGSSSTRMSDPDDDPKRASQPALLFFFSFIDFIASGSIETDDERCSLDSRRLDAPMLRIAHSMNRRLRTNLYYNRCCRFSTFFLLFFCCSNLNPPFTGNRYNVECAQVKHGSGSA